MTEYFIEQSHQTPVVNFKNLDLTTMLPLGSLLNKPALQIVTHLALSLHSFDMYMKQSSGSVSTALVSEMLTQEVILLCFDAISCPHAFLTWLFQLSRLYSK